LNNNELNICEVPLISCLMVTNCVDMKLIEGSIYSYVTQTYENKELIIVTNSNKRGYYELLELLEKYENCNIKTYLIDEKISLGKLRNVTIEKSLGSYCATWDSDDLFHCDRLKDQYFQIISTNSDYCTCKHFMQYFYTTETLTMNKWYDGSITNGLLPSLMFKKNIEYCYPDLHRGEDLDFFTCGFKGCVIENKPYLYIYTYHGKNAYCSEHYEMIKKNTTIPFEIEYESNITYLFNRFNIHYRI